jgi:hypothetical protein
MMNVHLFYLLLFIFLLIFSHSQASIMCCPIANVCKLIPNIAEIVKFFITTAETSLTLSFRGIAFYIVGLISQQKEIREIIEQCDWEAAGADR